jgi:type I pullulanase
MIVTGALCALALASAALAAPSLQIESTKVSPLGISKQMRLTPYVINDEGQRKPFTGAIDWQVVRGEGLVDLSDNGYVKGQKRGNVVIEGRARDLNLTDRIEFSVQDEPVQIYFQAPDNWDNAHIWFWYLDGDADVSGYGEDGEPLNAVQPPNFGQWPGPRMKPVDGRDGWYTYTIPSPRNEMFAGKFLREQPARIIFNNPARGEQTRTMLHYDGCFLSYNRYFGDPADRLIDGRWDSPANCRVFPKKPRLLAEPGGGPVWDESYIDVSLIGEELSQVQFTINEDSTEPTQIRSVEPGTAIPLKASDFRADGTLTLCIDAQDLRANSYETCYDYYLENPTSAIDMGASYSPEATTFAIWSPDRRQVELWLDGRTIPMGYIGDAINQPGVYAVTVPGDHLLDRYQFILDGSVVRDPYGTMVEPGTDYNIVMDISSIDPEGGWAPRPPLEAVEDSIVYEMSIRDFTYDPSSGVDPELRGKFLGAVQPGTVLYGNQSQESPQVKTGLDHLKELGVTHVQLLPIFDSATCSAKDPANGPNCYNWGYDPENWNVPEERYAVDPYDYERRVQELKTMVNEFHKAGIRVIMDVVYNHTWVQPWREPDEGEDVLGNITGKYFLKDPDGFGFQLTGTGNTIDPSHPMAYRLIRDSLAYWVEEYGIDGFRFDMAGVFDHQVIERWTNDLNEQFPERKLVAYGEPWTALKDPYADHLRLYNISKMRTDEGLPVQFGGFNFPFREAIKGFNDWGGGGGFAFNQTTDPTIIVNGLRGSIGPGDFLRSAFAADPAQTINYVSSHDNLTMFDKILDWSKIQSWPVSFDYQKRISGFANSLPLLAQGIPMIHSGAEMLRTKNGIHDSYNAPDSINKIDWQRKKDFRDVFEYYRALIQTRREFAGLRLTNNADIQRYVEARALNDQLIEMRIRPNPRSRRDVLVFFNAGTDREIGLPGGEWKVRLENASRSNDRIVRDRVLIKGTAATVLYRD